MNIVAFTEFLRNEFEVVGIKISGWGGRREGKKMERPKEGKEPICKECNFILFDDEWGQFILDREGGFNCAFRLTEWANSLTWW